MKSREAKLILDTVGQIDNILKGTNINKKAIDQHSSTMNVVRKKLDGYSEKYKNTEYMKNLSPPEKQAITKNAQTLYQTYEQLRKELEYLDMTKQPTFTSNAINALDKAYLLIENLYKNILGECGDIIIPKFTCFKLKDIPNATYTQAIHSLYAELENITHDLYEDQIRLDFSPELFMFMPAYGYMVEAYMWLSKEKERLTVEALPEIKKIDIPEEFIPEIPAGPEVDKEKYVGGTDPYTDKDGTKHPGTKLN